MTQDRWSTRRVRIKQFEDGDVTFYRELCASLEVGRRYRFGGLAIPPHAATAAIWDGVFAHWVGIGLSSRRRLGVVSLTSADVRNGTAYVSAVSDPGVVGTGLMIEAVGLALDYAFETWPFRKLYAEVPAFNMESLGSVSRRVFVEEGRLTDHVYLDGKYWDVHVLALTRQRWNAVGERIVQRLRRTSSQVASTNAEGVANSLPGGFDPPVTK